MMRWEGRVDRWCDGWVRQARAKAAEDEAAAVRSTMQEEQEQLRAQVEQSSAVVGQWSEAYQSLQAQYEAAQVPSSSQT